MSEPDEALPFRWVESWDRDDNALTCLEPLQDRRIEQLLGAPLELVRGHPAGKQGVNPRQREHRAPFLDNPFREALGL